MVLQECGKNLEGNKKMRIFLCMFKIKLWNYCPFATGIKLIFVCFYSVWAFQYFSIGNQIALDGIVIAAKVTVIVTTNLMARLRIELILQSVHYFYDASSIFSEAKEPDPATVFYVQFSNVQRYCSLSNG